MAIHFKDTGFCHLRIEEEISLLPHTPHANAKAGEVL